MLLRILGQASRSLRGQRTFAEIGEISATARRLPSDYHCRNERRNFSDSSENGPSDASAVSSNSSADWKAAMDAGHWDTAWEIFASHHRFEGVNVSDLNDLLDWDPDDAEKEIRRQKELDFQDSVAKSRVQRINEQGIAHGVGKRKTSVARVWIKKGFGHCMVNKKPFDIYFPDLMRRNDVVTPLVVANALGQFDVMAIVEGGGSMGQSQAIRHGISRALQNWDPELRAVLKDSGLLSRDARVVERKKPGKAKARKSFAWVKR